jgi:S1-C subfamily serine protease
MGTLLLVPALLSGYLLTPLPESELPRGYLGVHIHADQSARGIHISQVERGGPADKAGLKDDDLITQLDGTPVTDLQEFIQTVGATKPGSKLTLKIRRNGAEEEVTVKVGKRPRDH